MSPSKLTLVAIGGTTILAMVDGGLSGFLLNMLCGIGVCQAHQVLAGNDLAKDREVLAGALKDDPVLKEDTAAHAAVAHDLKTLDGDSKMISLASLGLGLVTFVNPLVGIICLLAFWIGVAVKKHIKETKRLNLKPT